MIFATCASHYFRCQENKPIRCDRLMLTNPLTPIVISHLQVEVHLLLEHGALAASNTFVKQQLSLHLRHSTALNGCRVCNDRVEIELVEVYLVRYAQLFILLEQSHQQLFILLRHIILFDCKDTTFLTNCQGIEKGFCKKTINLLT